MKSEASSLFGIDKKVYDLWRGSAVTGGTLTLKMLMQARNKMLYGHLSKEERRKAMKRDSDKAYRRSKKGLIRRAYLKMKDRIAGKSKNPHLYAGFSLLPVQDFVAFSQVCPKLEQLYAEWKQSGFDICLTPSVDRIDSKVGYTLENIRWITHQQNSYRAMMNRHHGIETLPTD